MVVGAHHPLAQKSRISLHELEKYDLALPSKGLQARYAFDSVLSPHIKLRTIIELNEVNILLKLLRQSTLVSVLSEATTHNESGVKAIPLDVANNEMTGCIHILKDSYRKKSMLEFVRMLGESIAVKERQNAWL